MIENSLEVGPFTPQELDSVCDQLKSQNIKFEVLKDEDTEKAEMKNDFANLVKKTEFRVETYLGQVFYLKLNQADFQKMRSVFSEYGMATSPKENPEELTADMGHVHEDAVTQKSLQSLLAWAIVAVLISFTAWNIFN
jgi:hypothetical protein